MSKSGEDLKEIIPWSEILNLSGSLPLKLKVTALSPRFIEESYSIGEVSFSVYSKTSEETFHDGGTFDTYLKYKLKPSFSVTSKLKEES